jgi:hypothetical protein
MEQDDVRVQRRKIEKDTATSEIALALGRLEADRRDPDHWERVCLFDALRSVFAGCYGLATSYARSALLPPSTRSSENLPNDPIYQRCDLALLFRALDEAMKEPVRRFPHLGPIEIADGPIG